MTHAPRPWIAFGLLALATGASAQEPSSPVARLFTAGEFPRLGEHGVRLPRGATYTVKVWTPAGQSWSLSKEPAALTLRPEPEAGGTGPRWQTVGAARLPAGAPVKIRVESRRQLDDEKGKAAKSGGGKKSDVKDDRGPWPALLSLSTDPDFDPSAALDVVRGRTDSVEPPADARRTSVRTNKEGADFSPPATLAAWRDRARAVREQLLVTQGLWPEFPRTPLRPKVVGRLDRDGYTVEKVVLETFPGFTLSGNLYRPTGKTGRLPAVLCPHGHWADGRVNPEVQQRCIRWAKLGAVVFMYDMVGYNDSKPFGHAFLNDRLRRWGLSLVTLQTWNSLRALDWITGLPDVDPARVGCTGESGGGTQTFLLTALDPRVKVAAPVVMVSDSFQGGCVCENCAGLRVGTDNVEIAALTAPRPLKLVGATGDWTKLTMTRAYPTLRKVYSLYGAADRISADVFDFEHNYNRTTRNAVYGFMGRWLLGIDDEEATKEGDQSPEDPEDLWTYTEENPAPANLKTPRQLENDLIRARTWELDALAPSTSPAAWDAARTRLQTAHRVRVGLVDPSPADLTHRGVRRTERDGVAVAHSVVGRREAGEGVPVVLLAPGHPTGRLTVISDPRGKASLVDPAGGWNPLVKALLGRGQTVVGFDPLFVGESVDPAKPAFTRPPTVHLDTYNPSPAADQMQDLATVLAWARSRDGVREVSLVGRGRSGPQALIALPALPGLARTAVDLDGFSEGDGSRDLPAGLDLPGLLQFGGVKAAAALAAPAPVWIFRAGTAFDRTWPEKAYALADSAHALRVDAGRPPPEALARWVDEGE